MQKPLNEYSFRDFKSAIVAAVRGTQGWYFSQTRTAYYADFRPHYPHRTAADFSVSLDHSLPRPRITLYADTACIPTIAQYSDIDELCEDLKKMEV